MAHRLRAINKQGAVPRRNQPVDISELLRPTKDKNYPNALIVKTATLERLSGVKNSSKTHYSALKKSVTEMQNCNLFLAKSKKEIEGLYQLLKKKSEQTLAILEVSRAVSNILPFDQILHKTSSLVSKVLGPVECYLYSLKQGNKLIFKSFLPGSQTQHAFFNTEGSRRELWEAVIRDKQPVWFPPEKNDLDTPGSVTGFPFLAVPLVSRGNLTGVLVIKRQGTCEPFSREEVELCAGIAGSVAVAIENWTLVEKLEKESSRLKTALLSLKVMTDNLTMLGKGVEPLLLAIGESLLQITDANYIMMLACTDRLVSIHVPEPCLEKEVLDSYFSSWLDQLSIEDFSLPYGIRRLHLKDDRNLDFISRRYGLEDLVAFPMRMGKNFLGLILLFFRRYKGDEGCQFILQILGNQTAIALENARLLEDILHLKNKAESHYRVACEQKEQLEQKNRELKNIYDILFRSREKQVLFQERNRIARDLHDNVLQILFAIGLNFDWCFKELSPQSPVYSKLKFLYDLVNKAIQEIRKAVCEFSSAETSLSLRESIESLALDLNQAGSVRIYVHSSGSQPLLPSVVRNIAYRIVQETLVNALKHSSASKIEINLMFTEKNLKIAVVDNGIGIPDNIMKNIHQDEKKFGLKNMMLRAKYLNGTLKIRKLDSGGTEVLAVIPIEGVDSD